MNIGSIIRLVILLVIIIVLVILFVVLGLKKKKEIPQEVEEVVIEEPPAEVETEYIEPELPVIPPENCEGPLKDVISPFPKPPEPLDPSQSECMEIDEQNKIIHQMLDWGSDEYPTPTYYESKFCTD